MGGTRRFGATFNVVVTLYVRSWPPLSLLLEGTPGTVGGQVHFMYSLFGTSCILAVGRVVAGWISETETRYGRVTFAESVGTRFGLIV
jgi:hypothetical protein